MGFERKAEALRKQADRLLEQAAVLESLPDEPQVDEDGAAVIWFKIRFDEDTDRQYTYSAVRVGNLWFVTGYMTGGRTWNNLLAWMIESNGDLPEIWTPSEWQPLS